MKNLFTVLALASISLVACKKDDEVTATNKFAGTWNLQVQETYQNNILINSESGEDASLVLDNCPIGDFCNGKMNTLGFSFNIKYKISADQSTITMDNDADLSTTEDLNTATIDLITATQFNFTETYEDVNDIGETVTIKEVIKLVK